MAFPLSLRIAGRYLRGRGSANAVPLLSRISMLAIAVVSAALIVIFSVLNGFTEVIESTYTAFYPDVRMTPASGKFFTPRPQLLDSIAHLPGITAVAPVLEDNALASNDEDQIIVTLKGVDSHYFAVNNVKTYIEYGDDTVVDAALPTTLVGKGIAARLGLDPNNDFSHVQLHYPNSKSGNLLSNPANAVSSLEARTGGVFRVQGDFDEQYVLAPLPAVQHLLQEDDRISAIEIKAAGNAEKIKRSLQTLAGSGFKVETRYEQNHTLYGVMRTEKWATYAILLFVLLIASVNMIGALALLVLEKQRDAVILKAMGARRSTIRNIFLAEGAMWAAIGGGIGLLLGWLVCLAQQKFGLVKLGDNFLIKNYPVSMHLSDFVVVMMTVMGVGALAAIYPAAKAGK